TNYRDALSWLYSLQRFGIKLGLENIEHLLEELSKSHILKAAPWKVIHVAGTNGKGSVCAMIDSICRAQGYRTGLFTSPHLVTFRERIRVNGDMISEEAVADGLTTIRYLVAHWDPHPTFFEVVAALALKHFSDTRVEIVILETVLGGGPMLPTPFHQKVQGLSQSNSNTKKGWGKQFPKLPMKKVAL